VLLGISTICGKCVTLLTFPAVVVVYSVLFMDWKAEKQPFDGVSILPEVRNDQFTHTDLDTKEILGLARGILASTTI